MSKKHTPTPLRVSKPLGDTYYIEDSKGNLVALTGGKYSAPNKETAEFIVKSYNNHDRLVEALKDARLMLSQLSRSVMAHPDHLISGAQIIEDRIETLLTELKS